MSLNNNTIAEFIKSTKPQKPAKKESIVYGIISDDKHVKLDGSNIEVPIAYFTTQVNKDERVIVMLKNHSAIITGNVSSQASTVTYVDNELKKIVLIAPIQEDTIDQLWSEYNK
jgi:hypothetical protein